MAEKCRSGASGDGAVGSPEAACRLSRASSLVEAVPFCLTTHPRRGVYILCFQKKEVNPKKKLGRVRLTATLCHHAPPDCRMLRRGSSHLHMFKERYSTLEPSFSRQQVNGTET